MSSHHEYYEYLASRSRVGHLYRKYWLYPRLTSRLKGLTLDVGCGIGDMLSSRPETVGADVNEQNVQHCLNRGLTAKIMSPDVLPFEADSFDSVLLDNVLEHILNPVPLLDEIYRVVNKSGVVLVGVPGIRGWHSDPDHKVSYDENELVECMRGRGFIHSEFFYAPLFRSDWLSRNMRQYCIYGKFYPS